MVVYDNEFETKEKKTWTTTYPLQIAWKIAYCVLILRRLQYFRCQQIQFQVANVLADMAEMKLKEQEQESTALSRGLQLFMRAKAGLGKKTTPWKNYAYTHMTWDWLFRVQKNTNTSFFCLIFFMNACALISAGRKTVLMMPICPLLKL